MAERKIITLKVQESYQEDINKGLVRIDAQILKNINAKPGDVLEIEGERKTVAIVDRSFPGDMGLNIIRIDGVTRKNAKTSIGSTVKVSLAENVKPAKKIIIAPAKKGIVVQASEELFKRALLGKVFGKGDMVSITATIRTAPREMKTEFDELFDILDSSFLNYGISFGSDLKYSVVSTDPKKDYVVVTKETSIDVKDSSVDIEESTVPEVTYEDIGGMDDALQKIREMVELPLKYPELFERLGIEPPKGILLYGVPGTGKTLLAKAVANETNANFIEFKSSTVISGVPGKTEQNIAAIFEDATKNAPSIIFIDELDSIAFKREERGHNEFLNTPVVELLKNMDGLKNRGKVVIIGATNRPDALDPALRRPGRFDRELEIMPPSKEGRLQILKIHTRNMPLAKNINLEAIADVTYGFVGADLAALARETAMIVLRRILPDLKELEQKEQVEKERLSEIPKELLEKLKITQNDFNEALKFIKPSALREFFVDIPNIKWSDIGGLEDVKQELKEAVEWPLQKPQAFKRLGIKPPQGILLYGAPGTGKTLLAKAVANESGANFISIKGPELLSKWVNETPMMVRKVFDKAKKVSPCIIFIDEIDSIAGSRTDDQYKAGMSAVETILTEMDGLEELNDVVVIAATNRPDMVDSALLRPGRFDRIVNVTVPSLDTRLKIFEVHTKNIPLSKDVDIKELAKKTEHFTGADIEALCREAAMHALRKDMEAKDVSKKDFDEALKKVTPSVSKDAEEAYDKAKNKMTSSQAEKFAKESINYFG